MVDRPMAFLAFFGLDPRRTKFRAHRVGGMAFLSMYAFAWIVFTRDYDAFVRHRLIIYPALIGKKSKISSQNFF